MRIYLIDIIISIIMITIIMFSSSLFWFVKEVASPITDNLFISLFELIAWKALYYCPFVMEIHWWSADFPHKKPAIWKDFPCHNV